MIKQIHRAAYGGLIASLLVAFATILFVSLSKYTFTLRIGQMTDLEIFRWGMYLGCAIAVIDLSLSLLAIRRRIPRLRQLPSLDEKLRGYTTLIKNLYYGTTAATVALSLIVTLTGNSRLIMFLILIVLTLFLAFPNMYKMKVDLGLDDDTMKSLFGDNYIPDNQSAEQ